MWPTILGGVMYVGLVLLLLYWVSRQTPRFKGSDCSCGYDVEDYYPLVKKIVDGVDGLRHHYMRFLDWFVPKRIRKPVQRVLSTTGNVLLFVSVPLLTILIFDMIQRIEWHRKRCLIYQVHR